MGGVHRAIFTSILVGTIGWVGLLVIASQLASSATGNLGFDLELLLVAGREVAAGRSPYDPAILAGSGPVSTSLFYSYPPPVAQVMALVAAVPSPVMLGAWWVGSVAGWLVIAEVLRRAIAPQVRSRDLVLQIAATAPLILPLAVGLLFGNFDVWFPLLYGTMLLAAMRPAGGTTIAGGVALAVASLKLHPVSMGLWFLVRGFRERGDREISQRSGGFAVVAAAAVTGITIVAISVALGGTHLWYEYSLVVRSGSGAEIVDPRNAGPASIIASAVGLTEAAARMLHVVVALVVVLVTIVAAYRRPDPLESFAWAAAASLATLPVTWYHYPSAMAPIALAALLRAPPNRQRRLRLTILLAGLVAAVAIAFLPLLWLAVGLVIYAAFASRPSPDDAVVTPLAGQPVAAGDGAAT
jgi:hypothetical protein